jgi:hypothetical protein
MDAFDVRDYSANIYFEIHSIFSGIIVGNAGKIEKRSARIENRFGYGGQNCVEASQELRASSAIPVQPKSNVRNDPRSAP